YAAFAGWQQELLQGPEGERLRSYWHTALAGPLPVLELPADRPRAGRSPRPASEGFTFDGPVAAGARALARAAGATLYPVLLAAFQALLHHLTCEDDLLVGTPTTGRSRAGFASGVGYYVNPVVLRTDLGGDPSFRELLARTRRTVQLALAHQDYPFAQLAAERAGERDPGRSPLVQVMFVFQNTHRPGLEALPGLVVGAEAELALGSLRLSALPLAEPGVPF